MPGVSLRINARLAASTRMRPLVSSTEVPSWRDWIILTFMGVAAAVASTMVDLHLRIPGHAILKAIFPMAIGFALVPRRGAGLSMSSLALVTVFGLRAVAPAGGGLSLGAITSLATVGPLLDWSLQRSRGGWPVWRAFALAGLAANLLALFVRAGAKLTGLEHLGARPLWNWLPAAVFTYAICGLLAGLISGLTWFCRAQDTDAPGDSE
ncbi:hypothetical protein Mal4_34060 [Maioricimonas rarisocia]|uniref:Thiamine transporter protein (Thia_YuaJ) n=1 Tax=Maioricimonas rarisocia TaxID=2528026 RepID=A0A517Z9E8_9PLAN|nr:hypothetical protein [Maioricimonas rarisocia]QDU39071.1 hypothetical protein Mal4_34060 [Maioricimonas rarisocia]